MVEYIHQKSGYSLRVFQLRSRHYVHFRSFVVRAPRPLQETVACADFWPKGVVFRRFRGNLPNPTPDKTVKTKDFTKDCHEIKSVAALSKSKMHEKKPEPVKSTIVPNVELDPTECPFREFRDNELSIDYWGMNAATFRTVIATKMIIKQAADYIWVDEQTQPLPRSVRQYLHGWVRAENLALSRWQEAETVIFEEDGPEKMAIIDMQLSHTQVLQRSSFCRRVLSACFILEHLDTLMVEHQWENFSFSLPEGWRPRFHIYSPGLKPGGGTQHRPTLSRNGCYLVRLYYLGAWRCVWVSDQVPVDASGAPLLPFSPLLSPVPTKPVPGRQQAPVAAVTSPVVHLWPLLLCKALLKLAAPDMNSDEESESIEDEVMPEFKIMHSLTGAMELDIFPAGLEDLWDQLVAEVSVFAWDAEDDELTTKSKAVKKEKNPKETTAVKRGSLAILTLQDTKDLPPYTLPGIAPGHEMGLYVSMIRDLPLKKPLPEPDVALWKYYRWVDWARGHGLYEAFECPRTRFLKLTGFLKLSYAPHLLDVQSTETITFEFRKVHEQSAPPPEKKGAKESPPAPPASREELRDWVLYDNISELVKKLTAIYFPSMYNFTTAGSAPPLKITKVPMNRALDIIAPKSSPMYLQIDSPEANHLKISISMLHPRVIMNCGIPVLDYVEPAYLILECFDWFVDAELPRAKAFVSTRGYDTVKVDFLPGRHYCRLWIHSQMNWHVALLSESTLLLGTQDLIQGASVRECPWAVQFLSNLGTAFTNLLRCSKSSTNFMTDMEFYRSYQPDLIWDEHEVGYKKHLLHWMFRRALQSLLIKRLTPLEFREACVVLRRYLLAPEFGLPEQKQDLKNYRAMINLDPCDCTIPEPEAIEESTASEENQFGEEPRNDVSQSVLDKLLKTPTPPAVSQICELATPEHLCGVLKEEREKLVRKHEAATLLQAHWRGTMARKCLTEKIVVTPEVLKSLMEYSFGNPEALSALMNEFFTMYPGAKSAYSVASALSGTTGLQNFTGMSPISPQSKWIPYFQGVFYCHAPVKVHFALQGTLQFNTMAVYDNDTGLQLPQVFRAATTFDIKPNTYGYMVMGHGTLTTPLGVYSEAHWQLTVLSSVKDVFHVCDNVADYCREISLPSASKLHIDSLFVPNRRNILGGIKLSVMQHAAVCFRAAASSPELDMIAILRTQTEDGQTEVVGKCAGKGELFWPYIKVEASLPPVLKSKSLLGSYSHSCISGTQLSKKQRAASAGLKRTITSSVKMKDSNKGAPSLHAKLYTIELICPDGWPLTLDQWKRVEEVRNTLEPLKVETAAKKPAPASKTPSARGEKAAPPPPSRMQPQPGDAYAELECSVATGGGIIAVRDDDRDLEFEAARRMWDVKEPGRNQRGAQIRKDFRDEFLEVPVVESAKSVEEETLFGEYMGEEVPEMKKEEEVPIRPTPVTESGLIEMSIESEEEAKYLNLPEALKDKFIPLPFIPFCLKESFEEERVLITPEMSEAGKSERHLRFEGALNRMRELQEHNKVHVLGQHRTRCNLLTKLFVDGSWTPDLHQVLEGRDDAITQEALAQTLDANKKKQDLKKK